MQSTHFFLLLVFGVLFMEASSTEEISIKMPGVVTSKEDAYLCTHIRLHGTKYITRFEPDADMNIAHHMLLFKCKRLISEKTHYPCGMPCYGEAIVYAWARQAKGLVLPAGVAFDAGPGTGHHYMVLQVHYLKRITKRDSSGVTMFTTPKPQPGIAGVLLMAVNRGSIPKRTKGYRMYFACVYQSRTKIYPFAFRTHAHSLGRTIFAQHFPEGDLADASLIGRASPQWPQAFYNSTSKTPIGRGDVLFGACVYDSTKRGRKTYIGSTHHDEMCNFYLMYYRKRGDPDLTTDDSDSCGDGVGIGDKPFAQLRSLVPKATFDYLPTTLSNDIWKSEKSYKYTVTDWRMKYILNGQVSGVSMDTKGRLIVFYRGDRLWDYLTFDRHNLLKKTYRQEPIKQATILVVDPKSGKILSKFGENMFYMPHGLSVDSEDNWWLTDVGTHQVYKIAHDDRTKFAMVLGTKFVPGDDGKHFCKPTDVSVLKDGSFFVSDGYCNSRVLKYSKRGKLLKVIRSSDGNFKTPHSLTLAGQGRLCVADRERARIECFSSKTGESLLILKDKPEFGEAIYAIDTDPNSKGDVIHGVIRREKGGPKGFTLSLSSRRILSMWGSNLKLPHDIASTSTHNFVADITPPYRVVAFTNAPTHTFAVAPTMSLKSESVGGKNRTTYQSEGFMNLLSENAPFLVGVIIVLPLAIIVLGAIIVHLHKNGMCTCFFRRRTRAMKSDYKRGRFEPLLNDKDDSDSEDNEELYNVDKLKKRCELKT